MYTHANRGILMYVEYSLNKYINNSFEQTLDCIYICILWKHYALQTRNYVFVGRNIRIELRRRSYIIVHKSVSVTRSETFFSVHLARSSLHTGGRLPDNAQSNTGITENIKSRSDFLFFVRHVESTWKPALLYPATCITCSLNPLGRSNSACMNDEE